MKRGDVYMVNFDPGVPGEPTRTRPAVLLTNDLANETLPHVVVAPVTSNVQRVYPFDVVLDAGSCGLPETSRVQLNYVRGLNRGRLGRFVGHLTPAQVKEVDTKLKTHLGLL